MLISHWRKEYPSPPNPMINLYNMWWEHFYATLKQIDCLTSRPFPGITPHTYFLHDNSPKSAWWNNLLLIWFAQKCFWIFFLVWRNRDGNNLSHKLNVLALYNLEEIFFVCSLYFNMKFYQLWQYETVSEKEISQNPNISVIRLDLRQYFDHSGFEFDFARKKSSSCKPWFWYYHYLFHFIPCYEKERKMKNAKKSPKSDASQRRKYTCT